MLHVLGLIEHAIGNDLWGDRIGGAGVGDGIQKVHHQRQHLARLGYSHRGFGGGPAERVGRRFDHLDGLDIYAFTVIA